MLLPFCYIRLIPRRVLVYLLEAKDDLLAGMGNFCICRHDRLDVYRDRILPEKRLQTAVDTRCPNKKPSLLVGFPFFEARFARKLSPSGLPVTTSEVFDPFGLLISFAGSENPCFFSLFIT
jgi:hypothetical protein